MGLPETRLRALAEEAGFSSVRRLPLENLLTVCTRSSHSRPLESSVFRFYRLTT